MATTSISPSGAVLGPSIANPLPPPPPTKTLSQADFLKLLVAQMKAQDPLNPKTDTEFISQMTQFSTLEQSKSMQQDIAELRDNQELLQADAMIGRHVTLQDGNNLVMAGVVSAVDVVAGIPQLVVNGNQYSMSQVLSISTAPPPK